MSDLIHQNWPIAVAIAVIVLLLVVWLIGRAHARANVRRAGGLRS